MATSPVVKCKDCELPYSEFGADMTLPHDQWAIREAAERIAGMPKYVDQSLGGYLDHIVHIITELIGGKK